jgi:flagellar motor switch protein FliN
MKVAGINEVVIPLEVVLGSTKHTVEKLSGIGEGTIIELDTLAGEPVEVRAGGETIAWGEVVVIDENFGVRVTRLERRGKGSGDE